METFLHFIKNSTKNKEGKKETSDQGYRFFDKKDALASTGFLNLNFITATRMKSGKSRRVKVIIRAQTY